MVEKSLPKPKRLAKKSKADEVDVTIELTKTVLLKVSRFRGNMRADLRRYYIVTTVYVSGLTPSDPG